MSNITQRGATGSLSLQANGQFQSGTSPSTTPGAYGTSATYNVSQLVGTRWDLNDGREVILVSMDSATTATPGYLYQDAALIANHQNLAVTAFQAYSNNGDVPATVTVTLGGTAVTANQYAGGYVVVNDGTQADGQGQTLRIASHPAQTSTTGDVVITLEDSPNTAISTSAKVCLVYPHGSNVIVSPTTHTNVPCGIALYPIAAGAYGYLTSKGLTSALSDAAVASVGEAIAPSVTTAGTVTLATATGGVLTNTVIGTAAYTAVSAKSYPVFLNL